MSTATADPPGVTRSAAAPVRRGDRVFGLATRGAGLFVLALLAAIAIFLIVQALPALRQDKGNFLTTFEWDPLVSGRYGIAALVFGTVLTSFLALLLAVPVAIGVALFSTQYVPQRVGRVLGYVTDLLAAVPSVIYGLWGVFFLLPRLVGLQSFLADHVGFIPLFSDPTDITSAVVHSIFAASIVLAVMVLPIVAAIAREVLGQVDPAQREAALGLGATRWEMIRIAVLPPSRTALVSAVMLGLGRALGETIAVALLIGNTFSIDWKILTPGGNSIAANIATKFGEANSLGRSALIASGLVLFAITLAVNLAARAILARGGRAERSAVA